MPSHDAGKNQIDLVTRPCSRLTVLVTWTLAVSAYLVAMAVIPAASRCGQDHRKALRPETAVAAGDLHAIKAVRAQAGHTFVPFQSGPEVSGRRSARCPGSDKL